MTETLNERLSGGVAQLSAASDADAPAVTPEIVPIGEGEVTEGLSGKKLYWPESTLREATRQGAFDDAKLLKGRPDVGHKDINSQASPDEIAGGAGSFEYEPGRGPVSSDGTIVDEHLGKLIDHGLVEISADFTDLEVGEFDEERGARPVESVGDVPYITILDRGAAEGASISTGRAEQLGFNPDSDAAGDDDTESTDSDAADPAESGRDADADSGTDDTDTDDPTSPMTDDPNDRIQELQEQLAAVKQEKQQAESQAEELESELDETESELEATSEELEAKEETIEEKEARLEDLESEAESFGRVLAHRLAGEDSPFTPDELAERYSTNELAEKVVTTEGLADEDARASDDYDPVAAVQEQLAQPPAHRGGDPGETTDETTTGELTEEQLAAADDRAFEVLDSTGITEASQQGKSPREYVRDTHGVDPAAVDSASELRSRVESNGGDA